MIKRISRRRKASSQDFLDLSNMKNLDFKTPCISPSLLAANKYDMNREIAKAERAGVPLIHIDIMDGRFVPNQSFGVDFVRKFGRKHQLINDVHLMIVQPWLKIEEFAEAGADIITIHYEACPNDDVIHATLKRIHDAGCRAGLSIKPKTPIYRLTPFLYEVDLVLVMTVEPGKGGQKFIDNCILRVRNLKATMELIGAKPLIEVDGGINDKTAPKIIKAGADIIVSGSYLYGHEDFEERAKILLKQ